MCSAKFLTYVMFSIVKSVRPRLKRVGGRVIEFFLSVSISRGAYAHCLAIQVSLTEAKKLEM